MESNSIRRYVCATLLAFYGNYVCSILLIPQNKKMVVPCIAEKNHRRGGHFNLMFDSSNRY